MGTSVPPIHDNTSTSFLHHCLHRCAFDAAEPQQMQRAAVRLSLVRQCQSARPVHWRAGYAVFPRPMVTAVDAHVNLTMYMRL